MSLIDRFLSAVTRRSKTVIAVMLVITLLLGSGMTMVDDDTSLDQFETDSPELEKLEYIEDNFGITDEETTSAQIVIREDNALDRESLIATLELQQELRADGTVNQTLTDEPFNDLSMVVARTAIIDDRQAELDERAEQLADEREQLDEASAELDEASEELDADSDELEQRQETLEADQQTLQQRAAFLSDTLNETREIQTAFDTGEITEAERDSQLDALGESAASELTDEQFTEFEPLIEQVRATQAEINELQGAYEAGAIDEDDFEQELSELEEEMAAHYDAIETQVLAEEFADLEERATGLEERGDELEERGDELEERGDELEAWGDELEQRSAELEDEYQQLAAIEPTTEEAIEQLESMNQTEIEDHVASTLDEDADSGLFVFLPTSYEPGSTTADARMLFVTQETPEPTGMEGEAPDVIVDSQLAMQSLVDDRFADGFVFGGGIISDEMDRSLGDSMAIVLPLALLFVTLVLIVTYRDLLDILLGILGIVFVLVWTFGFMGWTDIAFNIVMIAVPVLLVGLSVDYAIHVFMRHREYREADSNSTRQAMFVALSGVGLALIWVTATAVIGFLSNLISPIAPLREFGVTSAFGITAALLIFGILIPALKVETDDILESWGIDRDKRAFGTGGGVFTRILSLGRSAAGRAPWAVVVVALLLTAGGIAGASQVDTTFDQEDFIADDPPEWMKSLPGPFAAGDYSVKENLEYVNENFLREDTQANILLEGSVTDDRTLERIADAEEDAAGKGTAVVLSDGSADVDSPLSTMRSIADRNETFNETFVAADTTGDDVPDQNLTAVYDALFEADEGAASEVIYRTDDGEYEAVQMIVSTRGGAAGGDVTTDMRDVAASIDGDGLQATATGQLIVFHIIENELFDTVIDSLLITLIVVFAFLMVGYRWMHGSALLGAITLLPIVFAVTWILGTMYLLDISFNVMTGTITSLTVGLGIAYNIHMSERYMLERGRGRDLMDALSVSVTGTGGALLGSAATTIGGFGVLMFAILPPLQQFGLITGLTILYAFLGSVFVLPSFLALWTRYFGPPGLSPDDSDDDSAPSTADPDAAAAGRPPTPSGMESSDADSADDSGSSPERTVWPAFLEPGGSYSVQVRIPTVRGKTMLRELAPTADVTIDAVEPEPVEAVAADGRIYVHWDRESSTAATVTYTGQVSVETSAADLEFDGRVVTPTGETAVLGNGPVTVVDDVSDRLTPRGTVAGREIRAANRLLEAGLLTDEQYRWIVDRWLHTPDDAPDQLISDDGEAAILDPEAASNGGTEERRDGSGDEDLLGNDQRTDDEGSLVDDQRADAEDSLADDPLADDEDGDDADVDLFGEDSRNPTGEDSGNPSNDEGKNPTGDDSERTE